MCDFCEKHLEANKQAFADPRLHLIVDDARAQLEKAEGPFDVIIGDLADPVFGGPCYQVNYLSVLIYNSNAFSSQTIWPNISWRAGQAVLHACERLWQAAA